MKLVDELLNRSINLLTKLWEKHDKIVVVEDTHKKAKELSESNT